MRLAAVFIMMLFLSSCGVSANFRELERLELIRAVAVDAIDDGVMISAVSASENAEVHRVSSATVAEAVDRLIYGCRSSDAYFSHDDHVILGMGAAESDVRPTLDYIARAMKMRLDTNVFLSLCDTSLIMDGGTPDILTACVRDAPRLGEGFELTCRDISASLERYGCSLIGAVTSDGGRAVPSGFGILEDGRLIGTVPEAESLYVCILCDRAEGGDICVELDGERTALSMKKYTLSVTPEYNRRRIASIAVSVRADFNVDETVYPVMISDPKVRAELEEKLASELQTGLEAAIRRSQSMDCDYMHLGEAVRRASPFMFGMAEEDWRDVFANIPINAVAEAEIMRTYDMRDPEAAG